MFRWWAIVLGIGITLVACKPPEQPIAPPPPMPVATVYQLSADDVALVVASEQSLTEQRTAIDQRHRAIGEALASTGRATTSIMAEQATDRRGVAPTVAALLAERPDDLERYRRARGRIDALEQSRRDHADRLALVAFRTTNLKILRGTRQATSDPAAQARFDAAIAEVERSLAAVRESEAAYDALEGERRLLAGYRKQLFGTLADAATASEPPG